MAFVVSANIVIEHGRSLVGIQVKLAARVGLSDTRGLRSFAEDADVRSCVVIHYGSETTQLAEKTFAIPWTAFAG